MRVAVIDVGSNSVRLLIASTSQGHVRELGRDREYLRLGDDAYTLGRIGARKLNLLEGVAERYAQQARAARAERIETIVTAPGRQVSNADEMVEVLEDATRAPVVLLTAEDEGRLAWEGAVAQIDRFSQRVAVVDLGGGSCEIAVGRPSEGPLWIRSCDAGALRVTRTFLPSAWPTTLELAQAREGVRALLDGPPPPVPEAAVAVGGTARALAKVAGTELAARKLETLAERLVAKGPSAMAGVDITPGRMETLLGGTLVLAEVARRLDSLLHVGRSGVREGAALALGPRILGGGLRTQLYAA